MGGIVRQIVCHRHSLLHSSPRKKNREKTMKIIEIKVGEVKPIKSVKEQKADFLALLANYEKENPVKYASKKANGEFDRQLAKFDALLGTPEKEEEKKEEKEEKKEEEEEEEKEEKEEKKEEEKPKTKGRGKNK